MKKNFLYTMFIGAALSMTACEMDTFNEQDAIAAQKELMTLKYTNETELEKLRQAATTALEQLKFTNLLESMKLQAKLAEDAKDADQAREREDYTVFVTDMTTNQPLAGVDVSVASEGQVKTVKTNANGIAVFDNLALHDLSRFIITKEGYAAGSITASELKENSGMYGGSPSPDPVRLLNIAEANRNNTIQGKLYVETDLTNKTPETVPANTLVTATLEVESGSSEYTLEFPTRTDANGNYSLKLPDAPAGEQYELKFGNLALDQKLYVNGTEADGPAYQGFPKTLPRVETVMTQFAVGNEGGLPSRIFNLPFYLKFEADTLGKVGYAKVNEEYWNNNYVTFNSTGTNGEFTLSGLDISEVRTLANEALRFKKNDTISVQLVDFTGQYIKNAPKLVAYAGTNGRLADREPGIGYTNGSYVYFEKKDKVMVTGAQGLFKSDPTNFVFNYVTDWEEGLVNVTSDTDHSLTGGQTLNLNYTYGIGYNRAKAVY